MIPYDIAPIKKIQCSIALCFLAPLFLFAQEDFSPAIEDNSFYIEEAYNQEAGVVQHIFTGEHLAESPGGTNFTLTHEFPADGLTNQLSYTVSYPTVANGTTLIYVNYRYQLFYKQDFAAVAPRVSFYVPFHSPAPSLQRMSAQINIPFSKRMSNDFVVHFNAGATSERSHYGRGDESSTSFVWNTGGSIIWLSSENINFLLEGVVLLNPKNKTENKTILCPGIRFALNFDRTQVVPGIGFPAEYSNSQWNFGTFFYFSVELPYWNSERL
ncbi:MAG: hypothetical protein KGJ59_01200 [Bacteroidota bacterium]|nr:hypothetical protein [Bacteroidota bacterium]